jgi:hypothetical protein
MELTAGSETSENHNLTPGKYPKEHIQNPKPVGSEDKIQTCGMVKCIGKYSNMWREIGT